MRNMIPTLQMQQHLKDLLSQSPLETGEIRRIEGMGELYVSLSSDLNKGEYEYLYSLGIDDVVVYFYARMS